MHDVGLAAVPSYTLDRPRDRLSQAEQGMLRLHPYHAERIFARVAALDPVELATCGYADGIHKEGFAPLKDVIRQFLDNGGQLWACGACTKPRGIDEADLIPGAKIVTAANVVEFMAAGASPLSF
jgi:hypothetical protein